MRTSVDRLLALPGEERWLLAGLVVLLPAIGMALQLLGVTRTYRVLDRFNRTIATDSEAGEAGLRVASRMGRLMQIASRRGPYHATCLRRALALRWLLRRRGLPAEMRIGVGKDNGRIHAHAWVEVAGQPIGELPSVEDFAVYRDLERRLPRALRNI